MHWKFLLVGFFLVGYQASAGSDCQEDYIPPHTQHELGEVQHWASGGAFLLFAEGAGFSFDKQAYLESCPNRALFNFGLATGMSCLDRDVTVRYSSYVSVFLKAVERLGGAKSGGNQKTFKDLYLEEAIELGFDQFLLPLESGVGSSN